MKKTIKFPTKNTALFLSMGAPARRTFASSFGCTSRDDSNDLGTRAPPGPRRDPRGYTRVKSPRTASSSDRHQGIYNRSSAGSTISISNDPTERLLAAWPRVRRVRHLARDAADLARLCHSGYTMGIKFLCPNGHKLHVKSYLTGKKAICPKCGTRVVVPAEDGATALSDSTLASDEDVSLVEATETQTLTAVNVAAAAAKKSAPASSQPTADPIAESPSAVWYIRPATGGQYGPASGEIMRGWLKDGRVGASSLVWRAGWSEWRSAAEIFPQLGSLLAAPGPDAAPGPMAGGVPLPTTQPTLQLPKGQIADLLPPGPPEASTKGSVSPLTKMAIKRRKRSDRNFFITAGLLVLSVILLIVLMFVFRARSATPEVVPPSTPAKNAAASAAP